MSKSATRRSFLIILLVAAAVFAVWFGRHAGELLVVDRPARSDTILVLAGDLNDARFNKASAMLRAGYADTMLVDASKDVITFGKSRAQWGQEFIETLPPDIHAKVEVCPIVGDSTVIETASAERCLQDARAHKVLLVTSDFHTRRAYSIFRNRLPQYEWSVAAAHDPTLFGTRWYRNREWAKWTLTEWQRLVWWQVGDRWRKYP